LYKEVLQQELDLRVDAVRAKRSRYLPTVLTKEEVLAIINNLSGVYQLVVKLLYGTGLRQTECLQLRVKDLDFAQKQLIVRDAKGMESRVTMLPTSLIEELQFHLQIVKRQHQQDLEKGYGSVYSGYQINEVHFA
jgi:integrase